MVEPKQRRLLVLAAIIESYVETGEPVGSKTLANALYNTVSSATIRNDMASLTEAGYLEQQHASAGRTPTQRGYRLYVDHLMGRRSLPQEIMRDIDMQLSGYSMDPLSFLEDASRMLSDMTGLTA
ncbi:MAG: heat-inducible transcription repressor HrcA, partial [Clostridia bacterium]|nr:heat-inducible transcription repressor HrcA [Clostridia bacterium]